MDLFVAKLESALQKDPRSIIGISFDRVGVAILRAFATAIGSPNVSPGSAGYFCGNGTHPVAFMLTGSNETHPDLHFCNYLLMFGTSYGFVAQSNAMGLASEMADARARGMKLTVVDPVLSYAASQADEWVPIRPGTDSAFALALMHEWVLELDHYDAAFLRRYTNGTYLIGRDGRYVRDPQSGKPLVASADTGTVGPFDELPPDETALEGVFDVGGQTASPSFVAFKQHLKPYTPDRASEITTVPAATMRRIAREMADAAQIGQSITLEGQTLPLRPAAACWYRGISAHKHAMLDGMSLGHLNVLLGAVDVPGGQLNASGAGPSWMPQADEDGLILPGNPYGGGMKSSLPRRTVKTPETLDLLELFPVGAYARTTLAEGQLHGEKYGLEYRAEVLIQCRGNIMATGGDPAVMAKILKSIPFTCSMNTFFDETSEFADLLLPDTHSLERLMPLIYDPYAIYTSAALPFEHYSWNFQRPVVKAVPQARNWTEVLLDAIARLNLLPDMYSSLNAALHLTGPYRLDRDRTYSWEEIADRWTKSRCGDEHGLEYFYEHGYYKSDVVRDAKASYPRAYHGARIPLYLEHFIDAGQALEAFTRQRNIDWDTSDYIPLTEWKPCLTESQSPPEFDLWVVNQKLPFMTFSHSHENPWLADLAKRNTKVFTVGINTATAREKGIREGDTIVLETPAGKRAEGIARITEGIHPECLAVPGVLGRWAVGNKDVRGRGIHFNSLLTYSLDHIDGLNAALDSCIKVRVGRVD
jgi:anaerobic selenocysteine-containing dehydrogenase